MRHSILILQILSLAALLAGGLTLNLLGVGAAHHQPAGQVSITGSLG